MRILTLLFTLVTFSGLYGQTPLEQQLFDLSDVSFKKIDTPEGFEAAYELKVRQPLDHKDASKGHFYQRIFLSHRDHEAPTALITNGYGRPTNRITEVAQLCSANQIQVEHRYFLESSPDSLDYDYLNFEQVTADLHKINQLFKKIYKGKWIASGISKGGTTTIFYRYFYPDDVDVSIPYVAPVNHSEEDPRIYEFFDKVGTAECRADLKEYQIKMLEEADLMKSYLKWYAKGQGLKFNYLDLDQAYEYAVLEYPFSFWQWGHDCGSIPEPNAPTDTLIQHFVDIIGLDFYADKSMEGFASHYFQSAEEMGYYGFEIEEFKGLIKHLDISDNPSAIFTPNKMEVAFDGTLTNQVYEWTQTTTLPFVYINGKNDTWSATSVPENKKSGSIWFNMEGKHHGNARIKNLSEAEKRLLTQKMAQWLDTDIKLPESLK